MFRAEAVALALLTVAIPANAQLDMTVVKTSPVVVFDSKLGCDATDIPDASARAFRDSKGLIHFFASFAVNRASIGANWPNLKHDCRVVYQGHHRDNPSAFDDRSWLASFFTKDGLTVYSLIHNEFHGDRRPDLCPSRSHLRCWYNSLTMAISTDGGFSFVRSGLVAASTYRYIPDGPRRIGTASPSNIVEAGGFYYFIYVNDVPDAGGHICVARTPSLENPSSWLAWDGSAFSIPIGIDPYQTSASPAQARHCKHLSGLVSGSIGSLTRHEPSGVYILTQTSAEIPGRKAGLYYALSSDLVTWSRPVLLWQVPTYVATCATDALFDYPSLIDPSSTSRNFETIGDRPFLYVVRRMFKDCKGTMNRQLIRVPIAIHRTEKTVR